MTTETSSYEWRVVEFGGRHYPQARPIRRGIWKLLGPPLWECLGGLAGSVRLYEHWTPFGGSAWQSGYASRDEAEKLVESAKRAEQEYLRGLDVIYETRMVGR